MSDITLHYAIDRAAALAAGHAIAQSKGHLPLTDDALAALAPESRAFLARHLAGPVVELTGTVNNGMTPWPEQSRPLEPADLPAFVAACMAVEAAVTAEREARIAADAAQRAALEAEAQRERDVLASALVAPVACVIGFVDDATLYGSALPEYAARIAVRAWLASAAADLATYWDHHGPAMELGKEAIRAVAAHIANMREDRAAARTQWVTDLVTFFGDDNARERRAAGVLPRADVDALAWAAIQAPDGNADTGACPRCGDDHAETDETAGKPVWAGVWAAAQAIAGALQADVLETLGITVARDIVLVTYDCPSCEPSHRFELKLSLEHPANGWCTHRSRYYPLEEV